MVDQFKLLARHAAYAGLDLVFPPYCVHCGRVGSLLCPRCVASISASEPRYLPQLDQIWVVGHYEGAVRDAIHALKYEGVKRIAEPLGDLLAGAVTGTGRNIDLVIGVPLASERLRERGYNQAALIARRVAERIGLPEAPDAVTRIRNTVSQVELSAAERRENVKGAFRADPERVKGRQVLIIDDVLTTGSTLSACAEALRLAGASQVFGGAIGGAGHGMDR